MDFLPFTEEIKKHLWDFSCLERWHRHGKDYLRQKRLPNKTVRNKIQIIKLAPVRRGKYERKHAMMKLSREIQKQIFDKFGKVKVVFEKSFNGFREGDYIAHSWAGNSGVSHKISPVFLIDGKIKFGTPWNNDEVEYSENGNFGGKSNFTKKIGALITDEAPGEAFLLGYYDVQEDLYWDRDRDSEEFRTLYMFSEVSSLADLAKNEYTNSLRVFCEAFAQALENCKSENVEVV